MNIYKITAYDDLADDDDAVRLISLTVAATSTAEAKEVAKRWMYTNNRKFTLPESEWRVTLLHEPKDVEPRIIDYRIAAG